MPSAKPLMAWSSSYELGIQELDDQHAEIAGVLNRLHAAYQARKDPATLLSLLHRLIASVRVHFHTEEAIMGEHGYVEQDLHKAEHDFLVAHVLELHDEFAAGKTGMTDSVMEYLKDWLRNHMLVADRRLGHWLKERGLE
jgi:hemerythrin